MTDIELKTLKENLWHSADMLRAGAHLVANNFVMPMCFSNSIRQR